MIIYIKDHNNMKKLRYIFCLVQQRHTNAYKEFDDVGVSGIHQNIEEKVCIKQTIPIKDLLI